MGTKRFLRNAKSLKITVTIVGFLLSAVSGLLLFRSIQAATLEKLHSNVDERALLLHRQLTLNFEALMSLRVLVKHTTNLTWDQFQEESEAILERYPNIQALEWVPRISQIDRRRYETQIQAQFPQFQITERLDNGDIARAAVRSEYFPISHVTPLAGNEVVFGFDLASDPNRQSTLEASRLTGQALATGPLQLLQSTKQQTGFLVFLPIYQGNPQTPEERRSAIQGFVVGVYNIQDIFLASALNNTLADLKITLVDKTHPDQPLPLCEHSWRAAASNRWTYTKPLPNILGRQWSLVAYPSASYLIRQAIPLPLTVFITGLIFTIGTSLYIDAIARQADAIEEKKKQIEQAHRLAEAQIQQQLVGMEAAVDGIAVLQAGEYRYLNPAHVKMFGYTSAEELLGQSWEILYSPPEIERFHTEVLPFFREQGVWQGEAIGMRKDGTTFYEGLSLTLTEDGSIVCVCQNISDRKLAELTLKETNAKLERATRLKDEFLANMSHELRTPLNAILGLTEVLLERLHGPLNQQQSKALQTITYSGQHLLDLINDILDLAKIESGKMELHYSPTSIPELCQSSLIFVQQNAFKKQISLQTKVAPQVPCFHLDQRRIRQVLINLLNNAVKFTPQGGSVTLEVLADLPAYFQPPEDLSPPLNGSEPASPSFKDELNLKDEPNPRENQAKIAAATAHTAVSPQATANTAIPQATTQETPHSRRIAQDIPRKTPQETPQAIPPHNPSPGQPQDCSTIRPCYVRFKVIDNGIGISEESVTQLFQSFVQIDSALNRKYAGTGLGLSLVKQIVELHGGRVGVRSQEGVGSEFWFDLPCCSQACPLPLPKVPFSPPTIAPAAPAPPRFPSRILLAEDHPANIKTICSYLQMKGYEVIVAENGQRAIELARSEHPALMIMDVQMPQIDGLSAIQILRADPAFATTPIIALTALVMQGDRDRCLAAGATDYLSKPVRLSQLLQMMQRLLSHPGAPSPRVTLPEASFKV